MTRISKGSQEVIKLNTELPMRSVQNPYEGMRLVTLTNGIPLAYRYIAIGAMSLGLAMCSPVGSDPLPPLALPCTEGYFPQFFPHFFNHKE